MIIGKSDTATLLLLTCAATMSEVNVISISFRALSSSVIILYLYATIVFIILHLLRVDIYTNSRKLQQSNR